VAIEDQFVDYYDLLQLSPNADTETISRIFRHLAKQCHPDLPQGGNPDRFRQLLKAYRTLAKAKTRAAYDLLYQDYWERKWRIVRQAGDEKTYYDSRDFRERLLSLLYVQRRTNQNHPGLGDMEIARLMHTPQEFIEFELWYLREKGWVERLETGQLAISVEGVDEVERTRLRLSEDRLLEANNQEHR
jgi:curved DNA-binding protein CbpA